MRRRGFVGLILAGSLLGLPSCSLADDAPDYRYRLTVEVDTPEGLRTGSSVIEVEQRLVRPGSDPSARAVRRSIRGEAVAVDLPDGRVLFALLRSKDNVDWAGYILPWLAPDRSGRTFEEKLGAPLSLKGEVAVPRRFPRRAGSILHENEAWPMLVTFGDLADPTSVSEVDPDDMAASFGEGYAINRITVQLTDEPVTTGIEERLGWLTDPTVMENPGWRSLPLDVRKILIGFRAGKVGSEK